MQGELTNGRTVKIPSLQSESSSRNCLSFRNFILFRFCKIFSHSLLLINPLSSRVWEGRTFQGLTLDIERGNLLRLGKDGIILAASHGTRKMNDLEIERVYGRGRKRHVASDYATHLHVRNWLLKIHLNYTSLMDKIKLCDLNLELLEHHSMSTSFLYFWQDEL